MGIEAGGCLCGACRYETRADPLRVTICHCHFCQNATGSAFMVEPVFRREDLFITRGLPAEHRLRSAGSGRMVGMHFCRNCGSRLYLSFERFPGIFGLYAGSFDNPHWFPIRPDNSKHIFLSAARPGTVIPAGFPVFREHAITDDGTPVAPVVFQRPHVIGEPWPHPLP